ncbi:hypothetical protein IMG5_106320 [Ichthyophthirius multifiliis]|uniref:UDENN domain-containing protein n=1 Tax=Ichthyophthirius multifiliis TaxID=5932 RepID=G0QT55_ICHMU|nr:hypothetical protein IMG5_106320 [Ichthyophthirius multifiliis]EGR31580.1 hypothetical protein IMG5_106320 [Ichthyophthirius multifiliis]|eukprot:XP_004035066.1 hypothetical protein IMG5_106320 [Ichthyophthirius multifiliis]
MEIDFSNDKIQNILNEQIIPQQQQKNEQNILLQNPLFLIGVVGFHHKKGSIIEFYYPSNIHGLDEKKQQYIKDWLPIYCMPDAIHNKNEDFIYFTIIIDDVMLYCVSYFKQIQVKNDQMRQNNKELTRSHLQKSLFVLSTLPLQGYIMSRLEPTTRAYFNQININDYEILESAYQNMNQSLKNTHNLKDSEIYIGTPVKTLVYFFKEKVLQIVKAILLEKRIIVYSLNSCACSNFIISIISLFPGLSHFNFSNSFYISIVKKALNEYGFPLRIFNEIDKPIEMYFTVQNLDQIEKYKSYLIGTTSQLIKTHKKTQADLIIDLDQNSIIYQNENIKNLLQLNSEEKKFMENIYKISKQYISEEQKDWKNMEYSATFTQFVGSNDWIRIQFYEYFINLVCELQMIKGRFEQKKNENLSKDLEDFEDYLESDDESQQQSQNYQQMKGVEDDKIKYLKQQKKLIKNSYNFLKKYNTKFIFEYLQTQNYKFWKQNHDESIALRSINSIENNTKAIIFFQNGEVYAGGMQNGLKNGKGCKFDQIDQKIEICENYLNNLKQGHTVIKSIRNSEFYFEGQYINDMREGFGNLIFENQKYTGNFKNDKLHGQGQLVNENDASIYEGEFQNNKKKGMGKFKNNEICYIGQFENDLFEGKGQIIFSNNGDVYSGDFKKGKMHGQGELQGVSFVYKGEFQDGKFNGQGQYEILESKNVYQGFFKNGVLDESKQQIIKYKDGSIYNGMIKNWEKNGEGVLCHVDGKIENGVFENGVLIKN